MILIPEEVGFVISTTDTSLIYSERSNVKIKVDTISKDNFLEGIFQYDAVELNFILVAEVKCSSLNFSEGRYGEFELFKLNDLPATQHWKKYGFHPEPGIYQVDESKWLERSIGLYDPLSRLNLKHYLIEGNDCYVEILSSGYSYKYDSCDL